MGTQFGLAPLNQLDQTRKLPRGTTKGCAQ